MALLAACSSADLPTSPLTQVNSVANWDINQALGYVRVCKTGGPAGAYTFRVDVNGGGTWKTEWGTGNTTVLEFDGTNPVCRHMYGAVLDDTWEEGETAEVTITEVLGAGMSVIKIDMYNVILPFPGYITTLYNTNTATVTTTPFDRFKLEYTNAELPPPPVTANCYAINGVAGVAITPVQLEGSGGTGGPYTFSATGLPDGLTLSASGLLSGTPTTSGNSSYTVTVTDKDGNTGSGGTCGVSINARPSASCYAINGVEGVAITPVQLTGSGGAGGPYTFSATGLPAGLTLSASGLLSGTPSTTGSFSYTVTVTDKDGNTGSGGTCAVTIKPRFAGETAVGAGIPYPNTKNWFMYTPYTTSKVDLIAGQHYDAGDIYMSRSGGNTIIRIVFQNGFSWADVTGNLKINPFNSAPTDYLQPGAFQYHFNVTGNTVTVTIPGTSAKFYGIHGDVLRPLQ